MSTNQIQATQAQGEVINLIPKSQLALAHYLQNRKLRLARLEEQIKLQETPRLNLDLLSQILTLKMDLRQLQGAQGQEVII